MVLAAGIVGVVAGAAALSLLRRRKVRRLEGVAAHKDDLIAAVSHELRGPLTSVLGFAQALRDPGSGLSEEERDELLGFIVAEAEAMQAVVEDLIAASRLQRGVGVPVRREEIGDLAGEVRDLVARAVVLQGAEVTVSGEGKAYGDVARFRQIMRNLLTNAAVHGDPPIDVVVGTDDGTVRVQVRDRGRGIPADIAAAMFDRNQAAPDPQAATSTGIGLWLSAELAAAMGGALRYIGDDGGTAFELTLPAYDSSKEARRGG
jgi:signal transduction histidine kinase